MHKSQDVMYRMPTIVNNTTLFIWKLLREYVPKVRIMRKKLNLWEVMDRN